jgi:hypothetical protein
VGEQFPKEMNVHLTFEEGLKLYFSLGQLLGKLNTYKRSTKAGRRAAANLCIYPHKLRITVNEGRLKRPGTSASSEATANVAEPDAVEEA